MTQAQGIALGAITILAGFAPIASQAQHAGHGAPAAAPAPIRISEEALHAAGGVPPGWQFSLPAGDPTAGRGVFVQYKCYTCHVVKGEQFPLEPGQSATAGPELTGMGDHHPLGFLVESILNPSVVVMDKPGYVGGDGRSIMPPQPDMTVGQLVHLAAYLRTLTGSPGHGDHHAASEEREAGPYRVRLAYHPPAGAHDHGQHGNDHGKAADVKQHDHAKGHGDHGKDHATGHTAGQPANAAAKTGRLQVFVHAAGHPVPYLPVTAVVKGPGKAERRISLQPTLGEDGFHYTAAVTIPDGATRITVALGPVTVVKLAHGVSPELRRRQLATFDWKP
jgi:hypothetical protein